MTEQDIQTPGWDAIDSTFKSIYGEQEPIHYATAIKYMLGGPDPLDGVSVFKSENPTPHWHYVSYGFSELYEKEGDDKEWSGFGFEMTFRFPRKAEEETPPIWPISLMQNLARYVFSSGNVFSEGHHLNLNGPICLDAQTDITAAAFVADPEIVSPVETPNGKVIFLQIVGITREELSALMLWNTLNVAKIMQRENPMLITQLERKSITNDPVTAQEIKEGALADGSSTGVLYSEQLSWKPTDMFKTKAGVVIGALGLQDVIDITEARIVHDKQLTVRGPEQELAFVPAAKSGWKADGETLTIQLTKEDAKNLSKSLQPKAGTYKISDKLTFTVEKTSIKDNAGKVVETVG